MKRAIATLAAVILSVAACSSSGSTGSATPDPSIAFCSALDSYGKTLIALDALTPSASVEEYKGAVATAKTALAALVAVSADFVGAQLNTAQTAQTNLTAAADELPAGATPTQVESTLQPYLTALIQEVTLTRNAICNTRPTASAAS
jgi:hypothetical protein